MAKSTWDSLDVQGSGFELLGYQIVSRLESQDVNENKIQGGNKPRDWNCNLDIDFKDDVEILAPRKPKLKKDFQIHVFSHTMEYILLDFHRFVDANVLVNYNFV